MGPLINMCDKTSPPGAHCSSVRRNTEPLVTSVSFEPPRPHGQHFGQAAYELLAAGTSLHIGDRTISEKTQPLRRGLVRRRRMFTDAQASSTACHNNRARVAQGVNLQVARKIGRNL